MYLVASARPFVCQAGIVGQGKQVGRQVCLSVLSGACADNLADVVDWLLIFLDDYSLNVTLLFPLVNNFPCLHCPQMTLHASDTGCRELVGVNDNIIHSVVTTVMDTSLSSGLSFSVCEQLISLREIPAILSCIETFFPLHSRICKMYPVSLSLSNNSTLYTRHIHQGIK